MAKLLRSWRDSEAVPQDWRPAGPPGGVVKVPVRNPALRQALQSLLPGKWRKVYRLGRDGTEVHYFEHASGMVTLVKHKRR